MQISLLIQTRWLSLHGVSIINGLKFKTSEWWICFLQTRSFSLHKMLIAGLECCGVLVDFCDVFISCLDSHSDGTHPLQSIHWWASDGMIHFSKPDEETNSSTSWMAWGWLHFQHIFIFVWNTLLKYTYESQNSSPKMEIIAFINYYCSKTRIYIQLFSMRKSVIMTLKPLKWLKTPQRYH